MQRLSRWKCWTMFCCISVQSSDKSIGATQHCPLCKDNFVPRVSYLVLHCIRSQMGPTYHFLRNFSLSCLINYWFKRTISFTSEFSLQTIYRVISSDCCNYTFSKYIQPKKLTKKAKAKKALDFTQTLQLFIVKNVLS